MSTNMEKILKLWVEYRKANLSYMLARDKMDKAHNAVYAALNDGALRHEAEHRAGAGEGR